MKPERNERNTRWRPLRWSLCVICCWCAAGCHWGKVPGLSKLQQPFACPGCQRLAPEDCDCGVAAVASGYHPTRWRSLESVDVHFMPVPHRSQLLFDSGGPIARDGEADMTIHRTNDVILASPAPEAEPLPEVEGRLIEQQSNLEPLQSSEVDGRDGDERSRYFFDIDG